MPILIAVVGIIATAYIWANRARNAGHIASDLADMAGDVKAAARRFGFSRRMNMHPVESIEDPNIAAAAIADAFVSLDDMPTREQRAALDQSLRDVLQVNAATAQELLVLGHWMVNECGGAQPAISRICKKLYRLEGSPALAPMMQILDQVSAEGSGINVHQEEALHEIRTALRVR
jgi:hypothetical protein